LFRLPLERRKRLAAGKEEASGRWKGRSVWPLERKKRRATEREEGERSP